MILATTTMFNTKLIGKTNSRRNLLTPALVLDLEALEQNIATMSAWAIERKLNLRPHGKSHKSPTIAKLQAKAGAVGLCCASLHEAMVMAAEGVKGLLITTSLAPDKIPLVVDLVKNGADISVVADHVDIVMAYSKAAEQAGIVLPIFVDLDVGLRRTGTPSAEIAIELASIINNHPALRYAGVQGYMGHLQHVDQFTRRREMLNEDNTKLQNIVDALIKANLPPAIVTGGGTGTHRLDSECGTIGELQVGSYLFLDVQYLTVQQGNVCEQPYKPSLFIQTSVVNINHSNYAVTDAGLKSFATDGPLPLIVRGAPKGATYRYLGDEHGAIEFKNSDDSMTLGDKIECLVPHCDPNVNLFDNYHVVKGNTLVDIWPVAARGNS